MSQRLLRKRLACLNGSKAPAAERRDGRWLGYPPDLNEEITMDESRDTRSVRTSKVKLPTAQRSCIGASNKPNRARPVGRISIVRSRNGYVIGAKG